MLSLPLHSIFLGPSGKLFYRLVVYDILAFEGTTGEVISIKMHRWTHQCDFTQHVPNEGWFVEILQNTANVSDNVQAFLRYGRNVIAYANQVGINFLNSRFKNLYQPD